MRVSSDLKAKKPAKIGPFGTKTEENCGKAAFFD